MTTMTLLGVAAVFGVAALALAFARAPNARRAPIAGRRRHDSGHGGGR